MRTERFLNTYPRLWVDDAASSVGVSPTSNPLELPSGANVNAPTPPPVGAEASLVSTPFIVSLSNGR